MQDIKVRISEGGRIVIPADFRRQLGVDTGDELILHMENNRLVLFTPLQAIQYVQEQVAQYNVQRMPLSEQLIADRQAEAAKHE
jgi:AbrB family looped-hinge helix DNA binding protein